MAARLVYLKTLSLLPRREEEEQLKTELTGQLLEYQALKAVAALLAAQNRGHTIFCAGATAGGGGQDLPMPPPAEGIGPGLCERHWEGQAQAPPPVESFQPLVGKVVSVESRMEYLTAALSRPQRISQLFLKSRNRSELVATFLALLEMVKDKRVEVSGETAVLCGGNSDVS